MTWFRLVLIECDAPSCDVDHLDDTDGRGIRAVRAELARAGWRIWDGKDWCPTHAKALLGDT